MHRRHLLLAATALHVTGLTGLTGCADEPGPPEGTMVEGDGWRGVLLDADLDWLQLEDGTTVEDVSSFTPTEADARRFEEQLPAALADLVGPGGTVTGDEFDGDVRQYTGVEGDGARHLVVAGICDEQADGLPWQDGWIVISDGGSCYWDATMDLATGEVLRLSFHGDA